MGSEAEENYLKETYALQLDHHQVSTSMLADRMGHSAPTVTEMVKKLADRKLVVYEPYRGITLTKAGRAVALGVIRRHRLLETFLTRTLGVPWDRVHVEAEKLEHAISEYVGGRIDEFLGHPTVDPHGSPIPGSDGSIDEPPRVRLADIAAGAWVEIVEVDDREPSLLEHLSKLRIGIGTRIRIADIEAVDGLVTVIVDGQRQVLGRTAARRIVVRNTIGESDDRA